MFSGYCTKIVHCCYTRVSTLTKKFNGIGLVLGGNWKLRYQCVPEMATEISFCCQFS